MSPCPGHAGHPELRAQAMGCLGCPPCLGTRIAKWARSCPSAGTWSSQQPAAKAPGQWGRGPAPARTPLLHPPWRAGSPSDLQPFQGGRGAGPRLLWQVPGLQPEREGTAAAPGHLGGERGAPSPQLAGVRQGGLVQTPSPAKVEGRGTTQQCCIPAPRTAGPASAWWGGPHRSGSGERGTVTLSGCGQTWRRPGLSG